MDRLLEIPFRNFATPDSTTALLTTFADTQVSAFQLQFIFFAFTDVYNLNVIKLEPHPLDVGIPEIWPQFPTIVLGIQHLPDA